MEPTWTLVWRGTDEPRMEIAHVAVDGRVMTATGTQIGPTYELRYRLMRTRLEVGVIGGPEVSIDLADEDFFDLGFSPLFNSLPVYRDDLLNALDSREYRMRWVAVPELTSELSQQRYTPLGGHQVLFIAGDFEATLTFDDAGFIVDYPGLAERIHRRSGDE